MLILDKQQTADALPWQGLIETLRKFFIEGCESPARHHHEVSIPEESSASLLLMPAWVPGNFIGVKQVVVVPDNGKRGLPTVQASYQLSDATTGELLAIFDGGTLTNRRTAAASALAASYLAKQNARHLLVVGTGAVARCLAAAHCAVRPIKKISIWGRSAERCEKMCAELVAQGLPADVIKDLKSAAHSADIISCATLAKSPLIKGSWLQPGCHLDLVGAFQADMCEADSDAICASELFVDSREGALSEAGDIIQPLTAGLIDKCHIQADLFQLCRAEHLGRIDDSSITVFKSVGLALEDLAAASLAYQPL